jgi:hypothetical protein
MIREWPGRPARGCVQQALDVTELILLAALPPPSAVRLCLTVGRFILS